MKKQRLSREESRQQTRQRLLAAAAEIIPRQGYQGTSVQDITTQAGFSRGAFYSNFDNKDELFVTLLRQLCEAQEQELATVFERSSSAETMRQDLRDFYTDSFRDSQRFELYMEAKLHATRKDAFRKQLIAVERHTREQITGFVKRYCQEYGLNYDADACNNIACGLMALTDGIIFARMLDPGMVDDRRASNVLITFFDAIINNGE